jgi:hypothetical protein
LGYVGRRHGAAAARSEEECSPRRGTDREKSGPGSRHRRNSLIWTESGSSALVVSAPSQNRETTVRASTEEWH